MSMLYIVLNIFIGNISIQIQDFSKEELVERVFRLCASEKLSIIFIETRQLTEPRTLRRQSVNCFTYRIVLNSEYIRFITDNCKI